MLRFILAGLLLPALTTGKDLSTNQPVSTGFDGTTGKRAVAPLYAEENNTLITIAEALNAGLSTKRQKRVTAQDLLALNKPNIPGLSIRAKLQEGTRIVTDGNAFECEHCDFDGATEEVVNAHETSCSRNPANVSQPHEAGAAASVDVITIDDSEDEDADDSVEAAAHTLDADLVAQATADVSNADTAALTNTKKGATGKEKEKEKENPQKSKSEAHTSRHSFRRTEAICRRYGPDYGWPKTGQALMLGSPPTDAPVLDDGAWADGCNCTRGGTCLATVCDPALQVATPPPAADDVLLTVHSREFLEGLDAVDSGQLEDIFEVKSEAIPDRVALLEFCKRVVASTVLGAAMAWVYGFAVSLCGGYHHASSDVAAGGDPYADVVISWIALRKVLTEEGLVADPVALYIDLDVHHADGFALAKHEHGIGPHFKMLDAYNREIWPVSTAATQPYASLEYLDIGVPYDCSTSSEVFLEKVGDALKRAERELPKPDLIYYMANMDALEGDPLGGCFCDRGRDAQPRPNGLRLGCRIGRTHLHDGGWWLLEAGLFCRRFLSRKFARAAPRVDEAERCLAARTRAY